MVQIWVCGDVVNYKKCILCPFSLVYQVIAQLIIQQYFVAKAMPFFISYYGLQS